MSAPAALKNLTGRRLSCHIGRNPRPAPILEAVDKLLALVSTLGIRHLDLGGGLGIAYRASEKAPPIREFIASLRARLRGERPARDGRAGRSIVARLARCYAGALPQEKRLQGIRGGGRGYERPHPSLASTTPHHEIIPVRKNSLPPITADVVGPICETGDFLARGRQWPTSCPAIPGGVRRRGVRLRAFLELQFAPRAVEVLVEGAAWRVIRRRETFEDLVRGETL